MKNLLKFSATTDHAKLSNIATWIGYKPTVYSFSLPSGHTCPFALDCLSKTDRRSGKVTDSKHTKFRCFSATTEAYSKPARDQRWYNFDLLRRLTEEEMKDLILESLPDDADIVRIHVGGDFFNQKYFNAWRRAAESLPGITFYAYTKSIPYMVNSTPLPANFVINASRGGRMDSLIDDHNLKAAEVVFSLQEADAKGLEIDHDERHAIASKKSFALLIHGTQPKGSEAAAAIKTLKAHNVKFAYSRK
jgi:hypothetical protein